MEDLEGKKVEPDYLEVNWDVTAAQKDGYCLLYTSVKSLSLHSADSYCGYNHAE